METNSCFFPFEFQRLSKKLTNWRLMEMIAIRFETLTFISKIYEHSDMHILIDFNLR